jgi:hypothetical protein
LKTSIKPVWLTSSTAEFSSRAWCKRFTSWILLTGWTWSKAFSPCIIMCWRIYWYPM